MQTLPLPQEILNTLSTADDKRVIRAIEAVHSGSMTINFRCVGDGIRATVRSIVWKGKKTPRYEEHQYTVTLSPHFAECSCPDYGYRGVVCAHMIASAVAVQACGAEQELPKAA